MGDHALFVKSHSKDVMRLGSQPNPIIDEQNDRTLGQNGVSNGLKGSLAGFGAQAMRSGIILEIGHQGSPDGLVVGRFGNSRKINRLFVIGQYCCKRSRTALVPFLLKKRNPFDLFRVAGCCKSEAAENRLKNRQFVI